MYLWWECHYRLFKRPAHRHTHTHPHTPPHPPHTHPPSHARTHTHPQALMSAVESSHRHRNQPSAAVPCRQPSRCQPSDLVSCCRAPSRHRHSPPGQRPIMFTRLRSLPQPFFPCRRVVVESRFHPSENLAYSPFVVILPSQFCHLHVCRLSSVICRYYVSPPLDTNVLSPDLRG